MINKWSYILIICSAVLMQICPEHLLYAGVADGYPPYQFKNENGEAEGVDIDILKAIAQQMDRQLIIVQKNWNDILGIMRTSHHLDLIGGIEITTVRQQFFLTTETVYCRKSVIFILANSHIMTLADLNGKIITGDTDSFTETYLKNNNYTDSIRIITTPTKNVAMNMLYRHDVAGVIAPYLLGIYIANNLNMEVHTIDVGDPGSPVGFAIKKDDEKFLDTLNNVINQLRNNGELDKIYATWNINVCKHK